MAPGLCTCGAWYTHHWCSGGCASPEGPVLPSQRARIEADRAWREATDARSQGLPWAGELE
eukprot:7561187-Alexandrium_andersonii.AAC.1